MPEKINCWLLNAIIRVIRTYQGGNKCANVVVMLALTYIVSVPKAKTQDTHKIINKNDSGATQTRANKSKQKTKRGTSSQTTSK